MKLDSNSFRRPGSGVEPGTAGELNVTYPMQSLNLVIVTHENPPLYPHASGAQAVPSLRMKEFEMQPDSIFFRRPGSGVEPGKLGECNTTCPK